MSRKRSLTEHEGGDVLVDSPMDTNNHADQQQQQQRQQHLRTQKRCCGTAKNPAPGELTADEVAAYLHRLSAPLNNSQLQHASMVLSAQGWQAFAELNMLLDGSMVSGGGLRKQLLQHHCFVKKPRAQLWQRYSQYAAGRAGTSPQQLELLRFLLEWVLAPYPMCSLTEETLQLPPWMVSWASRWGMAGSSSRIALIRLEAYACVDPCSSSSMATSSSPSCVLYVPVLV